MENPQTIKKYCFYDDIKIECKNDGMLDLDLGMECVIQL
jgi:hypothetical protein